jgi:hypothetical protein
LCGCIDATYLSAASLIAFFSAAADVLCAAFNDTNGVYMADAGRSFAHVLICNLTFQIPFTVLLRSGHRAHK